jgi:LPS-assembly protein
MKLFSLILGVLLALTGEAYSYDQNKLGKRSVKPNQESTLSHPEAIKKASSQITFLADWFWGDGTPLSVAEMLYLDADMEKPVTDWLWSDGGKLSIGGLDKKRTFPNWLQGGKPLSPSPEEPEVKPDRKNVFLSADHMTHDNNRAMVWAWGKVVIRFDDDRTLHADRVKVNNKTGTGKAIGNVIITQKDGTRLRSNTTHFNINNQQGRMFETRGKLGENYYVKGKKITRYSQNHFKIEKVHLTTCQGALPDWVFEAESMDVIMGDRAIFTKGVFKVRDVPVFYFPAGYIPINKERKSGLLFPSFGQSSLDGVTFDNAYYWAINEQSDATFSLGYQGRRGFTPGIEYRYAPNETTVGAIKGSLIDDRITRSTFWKLNANHRQDLALGFKFVGVLGLQSDKFNQNFEDNTAIRASRNTDSYATTTKDWENSSLEILTRYRDSTEQGSDQIFAKLPQITYKVPNISYGDSDESNLFFSLDTSFSSLLTDLKPALDVDDKFSVQRFDFHPKISYAMTIAPWLSLTPTLGLRETVYSKGLDADDDNKRLDSFSRESFDISAQIRGPRIEKIYALKNKHIPKVKHLIEPRLTYNFIPDLDEKDRNKIKVFDGIDSLKEQSQLTYSLTQRVLQKELKKDDSFATRAILRFDVSQTYDLIEATGSESPENTRPFSDIRFDLDSRLHDHLEFNIDTTFDPYGDVFKTWNFNIGLKPLDSLYLSLERRYTRRGAVFTIASLDWNIKKGWRLQASSRLDEITDTNRENQLSLFFDDPCRCWGFNFDILKRNNFRAGGSGRNETKYFLGITLRGLGALASGAKKDLELHRTFKSIYNPDL